MTRFAGAFLAILAAAAPAAAQVRAGSEFIVNTYTTDNQDDPAVALTRDGRFVIVWESTLQDGSYNGAFGQRFTAPGVRLGDEFQVNTTTVYPQNDPNVAFTDRAGSFVVVWQGYTFDGSYYSIYGQRYAPSGVAVGAEFLVNSSTTALEYAPFVAGLPGGGFVVSWSNYPYPGPPPDGDLGAIQARVFDRDGAPLGPDFVVNTTTTDNQNFGYVASSANGTFVVTWQSYYGDGDAAGVFAQRFDATGARIGGEFQVNTVTTGGQYSYPPSMDVTGRFVIVWLGPDGSGYGIHGQRYDNTGAPLGSEFLVNTFTTSGQYTAVASSDENFNFVVTWRSTGQDGLGQSIHGQRFNSLGAPRGAEFRVNTYTTGNQADAWVASDRVGNFVVSWDSVGQDGSGNAAVAQRFGGLRPAALNVDAAGNRVLDPGETAVVAPSWENINGAALTFGGALTNMTGPAGGTYSVTDGTAVYGTVPDGTTQPCTDCYTVSVSFAGARPATHVDASAVETITPDDLGQQITWLLHVGGSFTDVPTSNIFYRFIETLLHHNVTGGCTATTYCPSNATQRDQMAVFVLVAKEGTGFVPPACSPPNTFLDVPETSPFCRWIEELERRGVVAGCGGGNYCPTNPVQRDQMAVFVLRTLDPTLVPPNCVAGSETFADVPASSPFCRWVEELARRGVVAGCQAGPPALYCPFDPVTREQMGVFISVTFGLTLYGL